MLKYYSRLVVYGCKGARAYGKSTVLAVISSVVGVGLLAYFHVNPSSQIFVRTVAGAASTLLILVAYFLIHVIRAPWQIYEEDTATTQRLMQDLQRIKRDAARLALAKALAESVIGLRNDLASIHREWNDCAGLTDRVMRRSWSAPASYVG